MASSRSLSDTLHHLNRLLLAGELADLPDAELVGRFAERRDEAAFTALVRRHGTLVLGVCRRVLRHEQDAEDAFQATFLVLARDAGRVRRGAAVGNWLYGVAYNVARKAKAVQRRRAVKEREAATRQPRECSPDAVDDLREAIDRELHALPDRYRAPIVLCDLLGLTTGQAAAEVGCPAKTLGTRLSRGRALLARRLARRGVALPVAALAAPAVVPPSLFASTVDAAVGFTAGSPAAVTPAVAALMTGVSSVMLKTLKFAAVVACGTLALGVLVHGPLGAAHKPRAGSTGGNPPGESGRVRTAGFASHLHHAFTHFLAQVGFAWAGGDAVAEPADDTKDDKPALCGTWARKDGELKLEFVDKTVLNLSPHGKDDVILFLCEYTVDKDGLVKAKITGFSGKPEARDKAKEKFPVGSEFSFKWTAKGDVATLEDFKGEKFEAFKSLIEGEFAKK